MKHILSGQQFSDKNLLDKIFRTAEALEKADASTGMPRHLEGKIICTLFYEPSTRTRLSFESAALKLGAGVISVENAKISTSDVKGESLEDTIRMVNCYSDLVVLRHPQAGTAKRAADVSLTPVINGGDGGNEHPTQALFDVWTIQKELGRLDNLKIVYGFDPLHSRTIRSLSRLLAIFPNNHFIYISPKILWPQTDFLSEIEKLGAKVELKESLEDIGQADVIYLNRLQEERFENRIDFENNRKLFVLKLDHLKESNAIVLNPLPRIDEVDVAVDVLPNARYFQQAKNGLYVRAALLLFVLDRL